MFLVSPTPGRCAHVALSTCQSLQLLQNNKRTDDNLCKMQRSRRWLHKCILGIMELLCLTNYLSRIEGSLDHKHNSDLRQTFLKISEGKKVNLTIDNFSIFSSHCVHFSDYYACCQPILDYFIQALLAQMTLHRLNFL